MQECLFNKWKIVLYLNVISKQIYMIAILISAMKTKTGLIAMKTKTGIPKKFLQQNDQLPVLQIKISS